MKKTNTILILTVLVLSTAVLALGTSYETPGDRALVVKSTRYDPFPVEPGSYFEVWMRLENIGSRDFTNLKFRLLPEFPFSLDPNEVAERDIGTLKAGEQYMINFKVRSADNAVQGNNPLKYEFKVGAQWNPGQLTINIRHVEVILSIEEVKTEPEMIAPGGKAEVELIVKNLADTYIRDVRIDMGLVRAEQTATGMTYIELPFSPYESSNEKTIKRIEGGSEEIVTFDFVVDPEAESKTYKIPVYITYYNNQGMNYSKINLISITVGDKPDMIAKIDSTEIYTAGSSGVVTVKFVNKGLTDVKLLYAELEESDAYDIIGTNDVYVGNIDSDDYETADFKIYVNKNGESITLPVKVEYRDANNNEYSYQYNLQLRLYSSKEMTRFGFANGSRAIGIIVLIVIVGVGLYIYRRIKKKKK